MLAPVSISRPAIKFEGVDGEFRTHPAGDGLVDSRTAHGLQDYTDASGEEASVMADGTSNTVFVA